MITKVSNFNTNSAVIYSSERKQHNPVMLRSKAVNFGKKPISYEGVEAVGTISGLLGGGLAFTHSITKFADLNPLNILINGANTLAGGIGSFIVGAIGFIGFKIVWTSIKP